ncbi:hypothetical protein I4U23_017154 [Adineta vaga]|nr:hypothetical protein I4U23_017154 [Adineta vaga]
MSGELNRFDDIFHDYGDDLDEKDDLDIDFLEHFTNPSKNSNNRDDDDNDNNDTEQHLSQKLNQLSPSNEQTTATTTTKRPLLTPSSPTSIMKKLKSDLIQPISTTDEMPDYLLNDSKTFEQIMHPYLQANTSNLTIEDLRQVAYLEHQLALLNLHVSLWKTYLHSGTGQLINTEPSVWQISMSTILHTTTRTPLRIWPEKLKSIILADPNHNSTQINQITYETCSNYVSQKLTDLRKQSRTLESQLNDCKVKLNYRFTSEINETIKNYVQEYGIALHQIFIESQIAIIKYDYYDGLFVSDFHHETYYADQLKIFENLSQSKLNKETATMEVALLKQRVAHQHYSDLFHTVRIPAPLTLTTVQDKDVRQRLIYRYEQLLERTKSDMLVIHIRTAEAKMEEYTQRFDMEYKQFEQRQRAYLADGKLTEQMCHIMKQRFKNIDERLQTLYDLKVCFFVNAPTVKNSI